MAQLLQNLFSVHKSPLQVRIPAFSSAKTLQWWPKNPRQKLQNTKIFAVLEIGKSPVISESEIAFNDNNNGSSNGIIVKKRTAMASSVIEVDSLTEADLKKNGLRNTRRTKLVCTIGPASCGFEQLEALAVGGMNVARINMCHGTRDWHRSVIKNVRKLNEVKGYAVIIVMDTEGSETYMGDHGGAASVRAEDCLRREHRCESMYSNENVSWRQPFSPWPAMTITLLRRESSNHQVQNTDCGDSSNTEEIIQQILDY